jgi:hypothetical protein
MLDTDGLFRLAATNFQQAETHLTDCEVQLLKLRAKLDRCAAMVRRAPQDEHLWRQVEAILDPQPAETAAATTT